MARAKGQKGKAYHKETPAEDIRACLTCKRARCNGLEHCMLERKREMLKNEETQK